MDEQATMIDVFGWVGSLVLGILGTLAGACCGFFAGGGLQTIIGAGVGFGIGFLTGFLFCGPFKSVVDGVATKHKPPEAARVMGLGLIKEFPLMVTVHNCKNVISSEGLM